MCSIQVLLSDNHLLAMAKPAGLPVVPDSSADESLLDQGKKWLKQEFQKPGNVFLGVVHRLDRPVSGVVMFARTSKAAGRLSDAWRRNDVRKIYWAIGSGTVDEDSGEIEQWLLKDRARNIVRAVAPGVEGAKKACTNWRVLGRTNDKVFLEMEAITGRSHQLRVAATTLGIPLLGDLKYGAREPMSDRSVALHARRLEVPHPTRDERVEVEAPPPEIFERLWKP